MTHYLAPRCLKTTAIVGATFTLFLLMLNHDLGSYLGPLTPKKALLLLPKIQNVQISPAASPSASPSTPASHENDFVARRFRERKAFKEEMCRKMNTSGKIIPNYVMHYNREYKLLLCAPPKTGCSSLKRHLLRLAGVPEMVNVHSEQARRAISVRHVLGADLYKVLQSTFPATRVMVARHPLDRLVSGYKDKFRNGDQVTGTWAKYMTMYRVRRGFNTSNMTLTFRQFLEMIANIMDKGESLSLNQAQTRTFPFFTNAKRIQPSERELGDARMRLFKRFGRNKSDRHFRPITLLCYPCDVRYEYIFHTDTLTQDLQHIVDKLNITGIDLDLRLNNRTRKSSYEDYYKNIPASLIRRIYAIYKEDFLINNFTVPAFLRGVIQGDSVFESEPEPDTDGYLQKWFPYASPISGNGRW
ncbi:carbohydrate sulfotransferase 10-like [Penaeus indicus]|uniref:carbohydrate sulfotransferase 10-like n=1 Tax=Penaeus indicus TaxID=29960 RepID=UPI00300DBD20